VNVILAFDCQSPRILNVLFSELALPHLSQQRLEELGLIPRKNSIENSCMNTVCQHGGTVRVRKLDIPSFDPDDVGFRQFGKLHEDSLPDELKA
jgi:hypothetical protein